LVPSFANRQQRLLALANKRKLVKCQQKKRDLTVDTC